MKWVRCSDECRSKSWWILLHTQIDFDPHNDLRIPAGHTVIAYQAWDVRWGKCSKHNGLQIIDRVEREMPFVAGLNDLKHTTGHVV